MDDLVAIGAILTALLLPILLMILFRYLFTLKDERRDRRYERAQAGLTAWLDESHHQLPDGDIDHAVPLSGHQRDSHRAPRGHGPNLPTTPGPRGRHAADQRPASAVRGWLLKSTKNSGHSIQPI